MKTLRPVEVSDFYIKQVASGMAQYFWGYIFAPIFEILQEQTVDNSKSDLINAIKSGRVWYEDGAFKTKTRFSNAVASTLEKMGAKLVRGVYKIEATKLPADILSIISTTKGVAINKATQVDRFLASILPILDTLTVRDFIEVAVDKMYKKLEVDILKAAQERRLPIIQLDIATPKIAISDRQRKSIEQYWKQRDDGAKRLRRAIDKAQTEEEKQQARQKLKEYNAQTYQDAPTVDVDVDKYELNKIGRKVADDYVYNMNYWVKKWEVKDITKMRQEVADMVQKGVRVPQLQEYFEKRWSVAKNKAKFLAENESHLAGSVIQATQYQKLGCTQFKWGRSTSKEKRKLHEQYYGKIFSFDNPPIIDEKLGIRGLPRQIWNCKCFMLCVAPSFDEYLKKKEEIQNAKRNIVKRIQNSMQRSNTTWRYRRYG